MNHVIQFKPDGEIQHLKGPMTAVVRECATGTRTTRVSRVLPCDRLRRWVFCAACFTLGDEHWITERMKRWDCEWHVVMLPLFQSRDRSQCIKNEIRLANIVLSHFNL